ncbi:MAG: AsmA family protein [Prevotellaceae bacterium]|jgi:hypothetical protein|nr:AsmA family protein [Prevotellaceae bacterium]
MRKILKITGISLGCLLLAIILTLVLAPLLFKDKLVGAAKDLANKNLNATVDFRDADISLFRHFPKISVAMTDLSVVSRNDTLFSVASFGAGINVVSYIKSGNIDLQVIDLQSPKINAKVFEDGSANWDITKPDEAQKTAADKTSEFKVSIEEFRIRDGVLMYEDLKDKTLALVRDIDLSLKGDLSNEFTSLDIDAALNDVNLFASGMMLMSGFDISLLGKVDADMNKMLFTLKGFDINLNRLALLADGTVKMEENDDLNINLTYAAKVASLKTLLGLIPEGMLPDAKNLDTKGSMSLNGKVAGIYGAKSMPVVAGELKVENGYLKYAGLPKSIDNIRIDTKLLFDANNDANTTIDVNRFHFEAGGNPFDISTNIRTPMTDANIKALMKGKLDFASLKDALPLEGIDLKGSLTANVDFAGRMSHIEKAQYDKLNLSGNVALQNFRAVTADLPLPIDISDAGLEFTPKYVNLTRFDAKIGESDLKASGRLENFLNYALKDEVLKGNLQLSSNYLNCNQLMASNADAAAAKTDTAVLSVVVLPANVDFSINASIAKLLYDNLTLNSAKGTMLIKDHTLNIDNLSADFAGGKIHLDGKYHAENLSSALTNMDVKIQNIRVRELANSFESFGKLLPILSDLDGKVSFNMNFSDNLDKNMNPVLAALTAVGSIKADSLKFLNQEVLDKITSLTGMKEKSNMLKNINASFSVTNGKVGITPFATSIGGINLMAGGEYGLDESLNLQVDFKLPTGQLGNLASGVLSQIGIKGDAVNTSTLNLGLAIGGTRKKPTFTPTKAKYFGDSPSAQQNVSDQAKQMLEDKKQEIQNKVEDKLKDEVQKQKDDAINKIKDMFKRP